ncbi:MAG: fibronectin type III domain-containing protein [Treponema sp.]|jgi:hypothetical protein|nr:fibronectin type III domain-containing protein [Treponema sp.]
MKKAFYLSVATVLLFAVIFAGCDSGGLTQEIENKQTFPALPAPQNLKAVVKPGAIVIGWNVVGDAAGYAVYRKDAETHVSKRVGDLGADQTHYQDKVGYSNQLVDKRTYTYTVVAKGRDVGADYLLLNGSASIDATANIPM